MRIQQLEDCEEACDGMSEAEIDEMLGSEIVKNWPEDAREPAQLVIDKYGEPDGLTETLLTWHEAGSWKRISASKAVHLHNFPVPHWDAVQ